LNVIFSDKYKKILYNTHIYRSNYAFPYNIKDNHYYFGSIQINKKKRKSNGTHKINKS